MGGLKGRWERGIWGGLKGRWERGIWGGLKGRERRGVKAAMESVRRYLRRYEEMSLKRGGLYRATVEENRVDVDVVYDLHGEFEGERWDEKEVYDYNLSVTYSWHIQVALGLEVEKGYMIKMAESWDGRKRRAYLDNGGERLFMGYFMRDMTEEYEEVMGYIRGKVEGNPKVWNERRWYEMYGGGYGGGLWTWDYCEWLIGGRERMEKYMEGRKGKV